MNAKTKRNVSTILVFLLIFGLGSFVFGVSGSAAHLRLNTIFGSQFNDGFENGFGSWTYAIGSPVTTTSPVFQGSYSAMFTSGASSSCVVEDLAGVSVVEMELYLPKAPDPYVWSDVNVLTMYASDWSTYCAVQYFSNGIGNIGFELCSSGVSILDFAYPIQANTWYKIDLVTSYASSGSYSLYVNDKLIGSISTNLNGLTSERVIVGSTWGTDASFYVDAVSIGNSYSPSSNATPTPYNPNPTPTATPTPIPTPTPSPSPITVTVDFSVIDSKGVALSGAQITLIPVSTGNTITLTTDSNGAASVSVPQDSTYNCQATYNGASSTNSGITANTNVHVQLIINLTSAPIDKTTTAFTLGGLGTSAISGIGLFLTRRKR